MQTYLELEEQAAQLLKKAEELRLQERAAAVAQIKALMSQHGVTAEDLGFLSKTRSKSAAPSAAKYRGPNGELWSGGRGRKPEWVRAALAAGKSLEDFALRNH